MTRRRCFVSVRPMGWFLALILSSNVLTMVISAQRSQRPENGASQNAGYPAFEVISVKRNLSIRQPFRIRILPDGMSIINAPLSVLIKDAYAPDDLDQKHTVGVPKWAERERFDVESRVDEAHIAAFHALPFLQQLGMIQSILKSRFQMRAHIETRELPIYALVVDKGGVKMQKATIGEVYSPEILGPDGQSAGMMRVTGGQQGGGSLTGQGITMKALASGLTQGLDRPVLDKTGLTGNYDVRLNWGADQVTISPLPSSDGFPSHGASQVESKEPSIFTAVQEQLGLRLESERGLVKQLVIDHISSPSEN